MPANHSPCDCPCTLPVFRVVVLSPGRLSYGKLLSLQETPQRLPLKDKSLWQLSLPCDHTSIQKLGGPHAQSPGGGAELTVSGGPLGLPCLHIPASSVARRGTEMTTQTNPAPPIIPHFKLPLCFFTPLSPAHFKSNYYICSLGCCKPSLPPTVCLGLQLVIVPRQLSLCLAGGELQADSETD